MYVKGYLDRELSDVEVASSITLLECFYTKIVNNKRTLACLLLPVAVALGLKLFVKTVALELANLSVLTEVAEHDNGAHIVVPYHTPEVTLGPI